MEISRKRWKSPFLLCKEPKPRLVAIPPYKSYNTPSVECHYSFLLTIHLGMDLNQRLQSLGQGKTTIVKKQLPIYFNHLWLRQKVRKLQANQKMIKVVIGSGPTNYDGWLITDLPYLNALDLSHWDTVFEPNSIDRLLAEHVIEHWTIEEFAQFLRIIRPFLSSQGLIRLAVPDGFHPDPAYIDYVKPGGSGAGAEDHKYLHTYKSMAQVLGQAQYVFNFLEYFDEQGQFHYQSWQESDGFIHRSAYHDQRNKEKPLTYTSLIVDAWPKE